MKKLNLKEKMLPAPTNGGFRMEGYWVWCGSVIHAQEDGKYHMFASRWKKTLPMHPGWLVDSEIVRAVSDTPEGPYEFQEVVLKRRGGQFWDGRATHNPSIFKYQDKYLLFYVGITHPLAEAKQEDHITTSSPIAIVTAASQRIGLAVADSIYGPWKRADKPFLDARPHCFDNFMITNPAPAINEKGEILLAYKSRSYKTDLTEYFQYDNMKLSIAKASSYQSPCCSVSEEPIFDDKEFDLEDPFIWQDEDLLYHLIAKDMDGRCCGESRGGVEAYSSDGIHWNMLQNEVAYSRDVLWEDGKIRRMGNLERPFILFNENHTPTHLFFATSDGIEGLSDCKNTWNMVIPLKTDD